MNLFELLNDQDKVNQKDRLYGVVIGIVTNNEDPANLGRVKVKFPWLSDDNESDWARVAVLMAGESRGTWFPPQIDDEVLVAFQHGDIRFPIVLGALWNGKDIPPTSDTDVIQVVDKHGNMIELNENKIIIHADSRDIEIKGKNLTIQASENITIKGKKIDFEKAN